MIKNDKQLTVTKKRLAEFQDAFNQVKAEILINPIVKKANMDALSSQIEVFEKEIEEYESLRTGQVSSIPISSVKSFPEALIKTRIARGWSQAILAEKLGVKEQQVQRDEASGYETASFARITEIVSILELDFSGRFEKVTPTTHQFSDRVRKMASIVEREVHQSKRLIAI